MVGYATYILNNAHGPLDVVLTVSSAQLIWWYSLEVVKIQTT